MTVLKSSLPTYFNESRVLEIGSLDINGSIRDFFVDCEYIGIDIGPGKGVDVVCEGQKYDAADGSFDHVVSCEVMEHNPHWRETIENMIRLCRPGGLVVITCASIGRPEHGTTRTTISDSPLTTAAGWDYYRNLTVSDLESAIPLKANFQKYFLSINWVGYDLCFFGIKAQTDRAAVPNAELTDAIRAMERFVRTENAALICRARKFFAHTFGDFGFESARHLRTRLMRST